MRYNPALDGIRALAVLAVVAHHALVPGLENGRGGVDVFFVLSGFLITSLLAAEEAQGGIRLGAFYLRRARRLYPALLVLVGLAMVCAPLWSVRPTTRDAGVALLYLSDYGAAFFGMPGEVLKHTWSLSVEEHFYLLWPLAMIGLMRIPLRWRICLLAFAYFAATGWRLYSALDGEWAAYYRFDTRLSGLLLGGLLAFVSQPRWLSRAALVSILPLAAITLLGQGNAVMATSIISSEWLGLALVLCAVNGAQWLALPPLAFLGRISYGVYLFHWPIALLFRFHTAWPVTLAATLGGSVLLASLSYYTIERAFRGQSRRDQPHILNPAGMV